MADTLGLEKINPGEPDKRLRSLEASFNYTISMLPDNIKKLLYGLTIFKSPFPINVSEKVFNENIESIMDLYNKSLLLEIRSETSFGEIENPGFWLYRFHPAIRNYLENTMCVIKNEEMTARHHSEIDRMICLLLPHEDFLL